MGKKGARLLKNMYEGHMDKRKWGGIKGVRWGGETDGTKMESTALEQQKKMWKEIVLLLFLGH